MSDSEKSVNKSSLRGELRVSNYTTTPTS